MAELDELATRRTADRDVVRRQMAAFDDDGRGAHRHDPPRRFSSILVVRIVMPVSASASGILGVTRNAWRNSSVFMAPTASSSIRRSPLLAIITGSTTRNGMSRSRTAAATASTIAALASMPVLAACSADVGDDGFDLRGHQIGRQRFDHRDAEGVLRGHGGDGGRAVHAVRGECLEVGLNACAGAGIAAGDRQRRAHRGLVSVRRCGRPDARAPERDRRRWRA